MGIYRESENYTCDCIRCISLGNYAKYMSMSTFGLGLISHIITQGGSRHCSSPAVSIFPT